MLLCSVSFLMISGVAPLIAVAQNTFDGTSNYILLTLPFFIWGLPFYFGRTVYFVYPGHSAGSVQGPAVGFD